MPLPWTIKTTTVAIAAEVRGPLVLVEAVLVGQGDQQATVVTKSDEMKEVDLDPTEVTSSSSSSSGPPL